MQLKFYSSGSNRESTKLKYSDFICLYCGKQTTENEPKEHIFPESIGGNVKLKKGDVCGECNNKLGKLDALLKTGDHYMMNGYQSSPFLGKKRSGVRRKEQKNQKKEIIDARKVTKVERKGCNTCEITNLDFENQPDFKRALFKIGCNILCNEFGSKHVREEYAEMIEFVWGKTDHDKFSYLVSYLSGSIRSINIRPMPILAARDVNGRFKWICFIMTAGIFILELEHKIDIIALEDKIIKTTCKQIKCNETKLLSAYGGYISAGSTQHFGRLNFMRRC